MNILNNEQALQAVNCAKQCLLSPFTERVIGQIFSLLKNRDEIALNYSQSIRLMDKKNHCIEINSINEQLKNLLFLI